MRNRERIIKTCMYGLLYHAHLSNRRRIRRWGVHPMNRSRNLKGEYQMLVKELERYPGKYYQYFRMGKDRFDFILQKIRARLEGNNTTSKEKLVITLKYLATGESFSDLAIRFRMGATSVRNYIFQTVVAIGDELTPIAMPMLTKQDWLDISKEFLQRWNFPNCLGASDGKQVDMFCPANSGSENFNYKKRFSINLMAIADARYRFTMTDIGSAGSNHDTTVFWNTKFGKMWYNQDVQLVLPNPAKLPGTNDYVPYQLIADDAFGQSTTVMTPYTGHNLTIEQRCFNYRLSRARRIVENAFGILTHTWRILLKRIQVQQTFARKIVRACVVLHNFLRMTKAEIRSNLINRENRSEDETTEVPCNASSTAAAIATNRSTAQAMAMRNKFAKWCVNEGDVSFQYKMI